MIFHRISNWWLFLPFDQRWTGLVRRELGIGWCFYFFVFVFHIFVFLSLIIFGLVLVTNVERYKQTGRETRTLFDPVFISFLCSVLISYLLISISSYVIIDIWRQGLFIFMSDHLHILSSSYLAKSWLYCNSVFFIVFPHDQTGQRKPFDAKEEGGTVKLSRLCWNLWRAQDTFHNLPPIWLNNNIGLDRD